MSNCLRLKVRGGVSTPPLATCGAKAPTPLVTPLRDHCDLGIGAAEYTQWKDALTAFQERDPVEGMYPDDDLVIFFDNGNSWKGESMNPARLRGLVDDLRAVCERLAKWKHVVYVKSYPHGIPQWCQVNDILGPNPEGRYFNNFWPVIQNQYWHIVEGAFFWPDMLPWPHPTAKHNYHMGWPTPYMINGW